MAITGEFTQEMKQQQVALLRRGIKLNGSELRIYTDILDEPCSVVELAIKYSVSKSAIYNITKVLQRLHLIHKLGDSAYWETTVDLRETTDLYLRFTYRGESFVVPQAAWYLLDTKDLKYVADIFRLALAHLYDRAKDAANDEKPQGPSGSEVKSMFMQISKIVLEFHELLQQFIKADELFDKPSQELFELFAGDDITEKSTDYLEFASQSFRHMWNTVVSSRGIKGKPDFLDPGNIMVSNFTNWKHPYTPDKYDAEN